MRKGLAMVIFNSILALLAGVGVFIVGMNMLSHSLQKVAGPGMKRLIGKITKNRFLGVGIGALVTGIIQSSAATTVMTIGFVNIGTMTLFQATSVIMGANIGTTVTGLLVSLSSFDVGIYASVLAFIGVMMQFFKNDKVKNIGGIICGLGLIFIGLDLMSASFNNNEIKEAIQNIFSGIDFPLLLLLLGIVFTAIMQSSSAMTGLVIVMVSSGAMPFESGLFIILGANIGTCITALIATIGTSANAKRTGLIHLLFNVIGVTIFTTFVWIFKTPIVNFLNNAFGNNYAIEIAIFHIAFNVSTTLILIPFIKYLVRIAEIVIKDKKDEREHVIKYIDERLLQTPSIAMEQVKKEILNMALLAQENFKKGIDELYSQKGDNIKEIGVHEDEIDYMNNVITKFLIKLSPLLGEKDEKILGSYFHVVNDIERIGDYAKNFADDSLKMKNDELHFSSEARNELRMMVDTIEKMYSLAIELFENPNQEKLDELNLLEEKTDAYKEEFSAKHFERLSQNNCTIELGAFYTVIISSLERVGDHIVNIGFSSQNPTGDQISKAL
ncbi:MAG: Na/Pi cotransporter family protein [Bacilli bacterium]|nr:Na/Pi cotransporter family protein [Bacilli bacterium]